jgi:hypothetical protein
VSRSSRHLSRQTPQGSAISAGNTFTETVSYQYADGNPVSNTDPNGDWARRWEYRTLVYHLDEWQVHHLEFDFTALSLISGLAAAIPWPGWPLIVDSVIFGLTAGWIRMGW